MKVIGIDPGIALRAGTASSTKEAGASGPSTTGGGKRPRRERPELRLKTIFDAVAGLIACITPDAVVLEESFVGVDARTALSVGQARGPSWSPPRNAGIECAEYPPARVKQAVCGYGRAEKQQVQKMVKAILGMHAEPTPSHAADALAVAICHALAPPLLRMAG